MSPADDTLTALKDYYLTFHDYLAGSPEAESAWKAKLELMTNPPRAPLGFVQGDIHYTSPVDGKLITTKQGRADDLARAGCIPYEEGMKQDAARRQQESERALDASIDATVEREYAVMSTSKRERLAAELQSGADLSVDRQSA